MPWQTMVADVAGEVMPDGVPAYREVRVTVPRQSGKTTLLFAVDTQRAIGWGGPQRTVYTAQDRLAARDKWEGYARTLKRSPLAKVVERVVRQNGQEAIHWRNGSQFGITASEETSGHGLTLDLAVIDEAFAQRDERLMQAFRPAMVTRRRAQLWVVSTAGNDLSTFLRDRVDDGRLRVEGGERQGVCYFEWSAPDDADPLDVATWWDTMPALGITVDPDTIRADAEGMPPEEFRRAYLNQWVAGGEPAIDPALWAACADQHAQPGPTQAFAVDVSPDRAFGSIACASRSRGGIHVEVTDHRPGTGWITERCVELDRRWHPVAWLLDPASPAGSLLVDFAAAGVKVESIDARRFGQACGMFYDAIAAGLIVHRAQPALDAAVAGARRRPLGEAWAWTRRAGTDVSPLVAATLATYALGVSGTGGPQVL
jgi:phage terminase large subunit-like protein